MTVRAWCVAAIVIAITARARAHDSSPGVLAIAERAPGDFAVAWTAPVDARTPDGSLRVVYPPGCDANGARLACEPGALEAGEIAIEGPLDPRTRVVVTLRTHDGEHLEAIATGAEPRVRLARDPSWSRWIAIGVEHIAFGLDHVAFVLGLVLLVGFERRIVITITAFTIAHSITLALAALDVLRLPSAPVEATIAGSVVLVAREALHDRATLSRRWPWLVALLFGLVHGLGFAGALREVGLPERGLVGALAAFNVGVELGQLALVALVFLLVGIGRTVVRDERVVARARPLACYALGALGAMWLVDRTLAIVLTAWS
ncbi:HupE/UreJ family protein [Sandaracinus amylolyticus]|uniref:Membrane protein, putative n=1 Tax=Sandaracinus amylolyticus TaxID=927083 RepID=A0A0F6W6V8_9BACT|nr:HupE/UreJ family protein [Sandaracinus amylolyticus]AKF08942.1 membrane protein, putative [Sandaracinus amylolyticus]